MYVKHSRLLESIGCHVPSVYFEDRKNKFIVMEDIGTDALEEWIRGKSQRRIQKTYEQVIEQVVQLHKNGLQAVKRTGTRLMPAFNRSLYQWEHELFITHYLPPDTEAMPDVRAELEIITRKLEQATLVLIHRDLQSSNIYKYKKDIYFIDYQGMRKGAAVYDLASLLCDPYVMLPLRMKKHLLDYYIETARGDHISSLFWYAAIQRLLQALGAYGRLSRLPGAERFRTHIPNAEAQLSEALDQVSEPFSVLRRLISPNPQENTFSYKSG